MSQGAGDKTEKATPKKRKDARNRGQVLKSTEVNTAFCSMVMFGLLMLIWPSFTQRLANLYLDFFSPNIYNTAGEEVDLPALQNVFADVLYHMAGLLLPILATALVAGLMINVLQVGFMFTTKPLMPKLERISPLKGFQRIFSARTVTELLKSLLKVICLGYVLYSEYQGLLDKFPNLIGTDIYLTFLNIMNIVFGIALKMCLVMIVIAAFDYFFQWWKYEKDLRMTKQEVKDEYKLTEGDPQIKSKIRQKQRQMSAMRMMQNVPDADVVITNPTHYAIALKYEEGQEGAPLVVAKGQDYIAQKIKEVAREHGVEIMENKPLAQTLYKLCEVGDEIPPELYQAVADVLVYVYRQKQRMREGNR